MHIDVEAKYKYKSHPRFWTDFQVLKSVTYTPVNMVLCTVSITKHIECVNLVIFRGDFEDTHSYSINITTRNPILVRRAWFWHIAS